MKKVFCLFLVLLMCCFLFACDPGHRSIEREELNDVVSVELIQYNNPNQKHFSSWIPDQFGRLVPFDNTKSNVLETLPTEKMDVFLDELSEISFLDKYYAYDSPNDVCIKLNYNNGDFLILWANYAQNRYSGYIGKYSSNGDVLSFLGSFYSLDHYTDLIDQFFNYNLSVNQ